ncbi:MAG: peptide chain release factor N(5)-glutamine methyltransferase [Lachnospiraceae bacterium]|nr:peptide chain release factor N(5)-glutamine methyltransferase [Lachnospiraceae bacterium]
MKTDSDVAKQGERASATLKQILAGTVERLRAAGLPEPESDAWLLFSHVFSMDRAHYLLEQARPATGDEIARMESVVAKRLKRIPVQYITGEQNFYGLTFRVTPDVLIPRYDTEVLVDRVLKQAGDARSFLDLCTGSGCIAVTLMKFGHFTCGEATDISHAALTVAADNASRNGVSLKLSEGDLWEAVGDTTYDVIVSNPPYIAESERPTLMPEVEQYEPALALFAENDGLIFYERIAREACKHLNPGGRLFVEIGAAQGDRVSQLFRQNGLEQVNVVQDLAGLDRVVSGRKP